MTGVVVAMALSGCILFPPFFPGSDPFAGPTVHVQNTTDTDWVLELGGPAGGLAYAVGSGRSGTVDTYGTTPDAITLRTAGCELTHEIEWDGSAAAIRIEEPGTLEAVEAAPADEGDAPALEEYFECMVASGAPQPGEALADATGRILVTGVDGAAYALDVTDGTVTPIGPRPDGDMLSSTSYHAWSPDGDRLAYGDESNGQSVFIGEADGSNAEEVTDNGSVPSWSPDGTRIAVLEHDPFEGQGRDLMVVDLATGQLTDLVGGVAPGTYVTWSPDGTSIAYLTAVDADETIPAPAELKVVDAAGGEPRTIGEAAPFTEAAVWSSDGTRLAVTAPNDGLADPSATVIAIYDVDGGTAQTIVGPDGAFLSWSAWSPDGSMIAVTLMRERMLQPDGAIAVADVSTGEVTELETGTAAYSYPLWSPDGGWLVVTRSSFDDLSSDLVAVRPDGSETVTLATNVLAAAQWVASD